MSYRQAVTEHLRLTLLRLLADQGGGYAANESVLADAANRYGFRASRDVIRGELAWLAEQGLIEREEVGELAVATLTQRGLDTAEGRAGVPGVKRPSPGR